MILKIFSRYVTSVILRNGNLNLDKLKKRFYIDIISNDGKAYREAMRFACLLAEKDSEIKRLVPFAYKKSNTGWLERIYNR